MSVHASIAIADGMAHREMEICLVSPVRADGRRDPDDIGTYEVTMSNKPWPDGPAYPVGRLVSAIFTHRYGDDVTILIAKAGEAIREKYGNV